jgi:hypothetical protein
VTVVIKHAVIKSLPPEKLVIVENLLRLGEPYAKVADTIHGWGLLSEVTPKTLQQALLRYAKDNGLAGINELTELGTKVSFSGGTGIPNAIFEASELYWLQKGRVAKLAMSPPKDDKFGTLTNEIRVAGELLRHLSHLLLETGMLKRAKDVKEEPKDLKGHSTYRITDGGKEDSLAFLEALEGDDDASIQ